MTLTTADERVERVGCMMRQSEMEEGLLYCCTVICKLVKEFCIVCVA